MNAPADSDPRSPDTKARDHYRKALEDTIQEDNFSADATRARVARFARRDNDPLRTRTISVMSGTHESVSARDPDFRPIITRLQNPGKVNDREKRYELGAVLGRGGSGQIFAARDLTLGRDVAVKVLYPDIATNPARLERFINEARITAKLEHPYILPVYDLEVPENGDAYFSMRVANGLSLGEALRKAAKEETPPFQIATIRDRITVFLKILDALAFAHSKGVIHQDIKPDNIMLGNFGEVLVVDWGTAIAREGKEGRQDRLIGTPAYMAPEQARREGADERSDVYGLGATFFQMLTLRHPTWESDPDAFWNKKREGTIDPPTPEERAHIPGPLLDLTLKAIAAEPAERYQTVEEFRAALQEYLQHAESITLQVSAQESLAAAIENQEYASFNQALFGFQEALKLWDENPYAAGGISETQLRYSECALAKDDLELAASTLNASDPHHNAMRQRVAETRARKSVVRRRVRQVQAAAAMLAIVLIAFVGYYTIDYFRYFGQWKEVYKQDFTQNNADVHSIFISDTINWDKEASAPARGNGGLEIGGGQLGWLRDVQLHGDIRVEAQVCWPGRIDGFELFINASRAMEAGGYAAPAGHICQFGGYSNTLNFIAPQDHCGTISRAGAVAYEFKPGQSYQLTFEREGEDLSIWVDGKEIHRQLLLLPVTRTGFNYLGFRSWSRINIQNLVISRKTIPEKSSPLVAGDALYVDGHFDEALRVYRELSTDFAGSPIGEQALARAYLMTYAHSEVATVNEMRATFKKEMLERYPKSAYWSEIFDADCVSAWKAHRYSDALSILSVIFQRDPDTRIILRLLEEPHTELPQDVAQSLLGWARQTRNIFYLYLDNLGLKSLDPIANLKLTRIDCANNQLTSLQPLQGMPLRAMDCSYNFITSLEPLRGMPLTQLGCAENKISSLDPLQGMPLTKLNCGDNSISSVEPLHGMPLAELNISKNKIADLTPLAGVPLANLFVSDNAVNDLSPLKGMPLIHFAVEQNKVTSLEPLRGMMLQELRISGDKIPDLSPLAGMPLSHVEADNCGISDLSPLKGMHLNVLNLKSNRIADLEPLRGMNLSGLNLFRNPVSDLAPLSGQPLNTLDLSETNVASLEPLRDSKLNSMSLSNTKVADLSPLAGKQINLLNAFDIPAKNVDALTAAPELISVDWEKVSDEEFEKLLQKWGPKPGQATTILRASRLIRTKQYDKLKSLAMEFKGHHYLLNPIRMSWPEAAKLAENAGGHLLTISSAEEQAAAGTLLLKQVADAWIAFSVTKSGPAWTTGEPVVFRTENRTTQRVHEGHRVLFLFSTQPDWIIYDDSVGVMSLIEWDN